MQISSLLSAEACLKAINHVMVVQGQQLSDTEHHRNKEAGSGLIEETATELLTTTELTKTLE